MSDLPGGITAKLQGEMVLPRTLVIKPVPFVQEGIAVDFAGVFGGREENVWVATFLDPDEAQAWIWASKRFGQAIKGAVIGTRADSGIILEESGRESSGSVREAHESGTPRGSGSPGELPVGVQVPGGDQVGAGYDANGSPVETP